MDGSKFYISVSVGANVEGRRGGRVGGGGGVIAPQSLHSAVNLSHKSLSKMLKICKEYDSLALLSGIRGL